jgi:glucokinase
MAQYYLGVDLGGTNIVAGVVDENYNLMNKSQLPTNHRRPFGPIVQDIATAAKTALAEAGLTEADIGYVGLGVPSSVNPHNKHVVFANNLNWKDVDVSSEFQKSWNIPLEIGNDAECAALAESMAGAGVGYDNIIMITLGTGVGGGVVLNKRLFSGCDGFGTEPGHTVLVHGGVLCTCGLHGCLEAYASVTALVRQGIDAMLTSPQSLMWEECGQDLNQVNGRTVFDAARRGDDAAQKVVDKYTDYLASGLATLTTFMRPQAIIIGGGISNAGEYLLAPLRKLVSVRYYAHDVLASPAIIQAKLGNNAGIIGAALLGAQGA